MWLNIENHLTLRKAGYTPQCEWALYNILKVLRGQTRVSGKEGILPQDCSVEILPEFLACWPALWISDSRLHHKPLLEFIACQAALEIADLPGPTMVWANSLK